MLALELLAEAPQVEQPREGVVRGQLDDARLQLLALALGRALARHVGEENEPPGRSPRAQDAHALAEHRARPGPADVDLDDRAGDADGAVGGVRRDDLEEGIGLFAGLREGRQDLVAQPPHVRRRLEPEDLPGPAADHPATPVAIEHDQPFVG